jgi:rubredoxin
MTNMQVHKCSVCNYTYDPAAGDPESGIPPGTSFDALPAEWVCPVCGATKEEFEPS